MENENNHRIIFFDMDGVLTNKNHVIEISKIANVEKEMKDLLTDIKVSEWSKGKIGLDWVIRRGVLLLRGIDIDDLVKIGKEIPLMNGARKTIKVLKGNKYYPIIVSSGLFPTCNEVGKRLGINEIYANVPEVNDKNKLTGNVHTLIPSDNNMDMDRNRIIASKGLLIRKIAIKNKINLKNAVSVGNDENDLSMFENVAFSILFNPPRLLLYWKYNEEVFWLRYQKLEKYVKTIIFNKNLTKILDYLIPEPRKTIGAKDELVFLRLKKNKIFSK